MWALQQRLQKSVDREMLLTNSKRYDSKSNGKIEKAIQEVEGYVRSLKLHTEIRMGKTIPPIILSFLDDRIRRRADQHVQDEQQKDDAAGAPLGQSQIE